MDPRRDGAGLERLKGGMEGARGVSMWEGTPAIPVRGPVRGCNKLSMSFTPSSSSGILLPSAVSLSASLSSIFFPTLSFAFVGGTRIFRFSNRSSFWYCLPFLINFIPR